jgi:hypothetical protein
MVLLNSAFEENLHAGNTNMLNFYLKLAVPGHALLWPFPVTD